MNDYYAEGVGRIEARCPCCNGDPELCTLGPTGCSPRYEYDPETGEVLKRPAMELLDPSPLVPDWPTEQEQDEHDMWMALQMVKRRFPLHPYQQAFLDAHERGGR